MTMLAKVGTKRMPEDAQRQPERAKLEMVTAVVTAPSAQALALTMSRPVNSDAIAPPLLRSLTRLH